MTGRLSLSVALAVTGATFALAQAPAPTSACVNKTNGALRILSAGGSCRQSERLITFSGGPAGPPGPDGPGGPPGPPGPGNFRVNDSKGSLVGFAVGFDRVARLIGGRWVVFLVNAQGFVPAQLAQEPLYYPTADCSGPAYLRDSTPFDPAGLTIDGQFAFVGRELVEVTVATSNTNFNLGQCFVTAPGPRPLRRAEVIDMSSLGLVPPFSIAR